MPQINEEDIPEVAKVFHNCTFKNCRFKIVVTPSVEKKTDQSSKEPRFLSDEDERELSEVEVSSPSAFLKSNEEEEQQPKKKRGRPPKKLKSGNAILE
jgi:hypothetical protein